MANPPPNPRKVKGGSDGCLVRSHDVQCSFEKAVLAYHTAQSACDSLKTLLASERAWCKAYLLFGETPRACSSVRRYGKSDYMANLFVRHIPATVQVWDISGEDHSSQDLAMDKRAAIERRLTKEDETQDDAITK